MTDVKKGRQTREMSKEYIVYRASMYRYSITRTLERETRVPDTWDTDLLRFCPPEITLCPEHDTHPGVFCLASEPDTVGMLV